MTQDAAYRKAEWRIEEAKQTKVKKLDLSNLGLNALPETIGELTSLEVLNLGHDPLEEQDLDLGHNYGNPEENNLKFIPDVFYNLTGLKELNLSHNSLVDLPKSVGSLHQLRELDLSQNKFSCLPEHLVNLKDLQFLDLSDNEFKVLPEWIGNLTRLKYLRLFGNRLSTLPESLDQLTSIEELMLSNGFGTGGSFRELPLCISGMNRLEQLWAQGCEISELPNWISRLSCLKTLVLESNSITNLPENIVGLERLELFFLGSNELKDIPNSIANLKFLRTFDLDCNPLNPELNAAYEQGLDAIKSFLSARADGQVVVDEAKLILVGEGEVGKSCLLGALRGDSWVEDRPTTHGIEIKSLNIANHSNEILITLNGWDFGGQRVYRPTHQLFFSSPAVYLVVWKPREGPQQGFVKEWITLIKHREPEAKVIIVATHGGPSQRQPDIDRQELIDLFGEDVIQGFYFVDSKPDPETGECKGVNELKGKIAEVASALPGMGRTIPAKWHQVRETLKATGRPYMPYQDVLTICEEQGIEGFLAELCIRVYHTLGNFVHYHYDELLKDVVILQPDWLAKAISFVLDDELTRQRNGLVEFEHLSQLWETPPFEGEEGYPPELHPIFLRLMERFDLSYKVILDPASKEESKTSLIAQLVPDNRPEQIPWSAEVEPGDRQQTQICRIVDERGQLANAEGLFYQLIVRLHKYSLGRDNYEDSVHWQRGLMLDDDYNGRALLEHIGTNVHITVRAVYPEFFLSQLTREVKWLVDGSEFWKGLRCEIVVPCINPCGMNQPGLGQFEVEKLIASKKKGRPEYPCNISGCDEWQNIDELMRNAPTAQASPQVVLTQQISDELKQVRRDIRILDQRDQKRFQALSKGQKEILSKVDQQFDNFIQMFLDEAKEGPRLFSFKPVKPDFFDRPQWINEQFQLTLWCEHSRKPLPILNPDGPQRGVYDLNLPREWFSKAAPYLKFMTTTIGLVLPIAASASKVILDDAVVDNIEKELDLAQSTIDFAVQGSNIAIDWLGEGNAPDLERGEAIRAQGSLLRQLHTFLEEKDPSFGGLVRVQNKRKEFRWVHPNFVSEY
jgi:Leucine-rich repeat (LRR) protein